MVSPIYVSNNLIRKAATEKVNLTHLKLQKLLYITYARYLYIAKNALFSNRFEAWKHGPVLTEIYDIFKIYGSKTLDIMHPDANGEVKTIVENGNFGRCIMEVWSGFGKSSAAVLVDKTHEINSAWYNAVKSKNNKLGGFLDDAHIIKDGEKWFANG